MTAVLEKPLATPQADTPVPKDLGLSALRAVLPAHAVLSSSENTTPYECDGLTAYRQRPMCVVLPETYTHIQDVLRTCHRLGVPVVARGAGTGLSGGAMPHAHPIKGMGAIKVRCDGGFDVKAEGGSLVQLTLRLDVAAHQPDQVAADGQAQARATK